MLQILYEMSELDMLADPMAGSPGHMPKPKSVKPNFERFEQDIARLLPTALEHLDTAEEVEEFQRRWENAVIGVGVNETELRRAARELRGEAAVALVQDSKLLAAETKEPAAIELWAKEAAESRRPIRFDGQLAPLNQSGLVHFVRVHSQPLIQNYSWELKDHFEKMRLPVALLWTNFSDPNATNTTQRALTAFRSFCDRRRGTDYQRHVLCILHDETAAYYQREYGSHDPYPYPFVGLTKKLGFGEGDRFGFPFKEPVNKTVHGFFASPKKAARKLDQWVTKVLAGEIPASHESGLVPANPKWIRGEVQEIVWKTYQSEINGSTADVLLELYDDQRKKAHLAEAAMRIVAVTLKDYRNLKVARMEVSQNFVPLIFDRKKYSKDTEYYWVPPSLAPGEMTPEPPIRLPITQAEVTPQKLLRLLKKHTLSSWSLKEALEAASDLSPEVMSYAQAEQRADDLADEEKQQMIKKMMTALKKEKGMVDVGEMMGLKKAADTMEDKEASKTTTKRAPSKPAAAPGKPDPVSSKKSSKSNVVKDSLEEERKREERRQQLKKEEERLKASEERDREKRKKRKEAEKERQAKKKAQEAEARAQQAAERERRRKKLEEERSLKPTTPLFSWGQSKEQLRLSVHIPGIRLDSLKVNLTDDRVNVVARDGRNRSFILDFELREFIVPENASWSLRYSEEDIQRPKPDGVNLLMQKATVHRWDRLAQDHGALKLFMRKDWVQDDGELDEEQEDIDLPAGPNLKKLTGASLEKLASGTPMVVVALRFPWCDKCKEKDKHFEKAARTSKDKDHLGSIAFVTVDAREEKHLAKRHNITCSDRCDLLIFKKDEPNEPYVVPGKRFPEEIHIDCYKHLLPVVSEVSEKEQLDRLTTAFDTAIVGFFAGEKESDTWYPRFRTVARSLRGHALFGAMFGGRQPRDFGIEHDGPDPSGEEAADSIAAAGEIDRKPLVLLFKPKEKRHVEFTGNLTLERLGHFSKVLSVPLVSTYDFESRQKYQELKVPLGMLWIDGLHSDSEENVHAKEVLRRLALRFSGHLVFVTLNNTRDAMLMRPMGLDPRKVPTFGIATKDDLESPKFGLELKAKGPEELAAFWADEEGAFRRLESFCASFLDGTLEASHESAELPSSYKWPGPGVVHEVVWKTFRDSVYRTEHDVLLELYNPFRPQHRTYISVLDLVAEALANVSSIKVARMDTANNYVLPELGDIDKDKGSTFLFLRAAPERLRRGKRFTGRMGSRAEALPERLLRFVHKEASSQDWDVSALSVWAQHEAMKRIRRLRALEKDYEKKMQDEWMQKEMEEFERYRRMGKFDNIPMG